MYLHQTIPVIPDFFNIVSVRNPGGAFGFLADHSTIIRMLVFFVVSILAVIAVLYFYWSTPKELKWLSSAFAMILGGAAGNLVDRFRFGEVVDFLDVYIKIIDYHWPAFNVADSAITVGMTIFIWHVVFGKIPES
jgi:signal peptidase II